MRKSTAAFMAAFLLLASAWGQSGRIPSTSTNETISGKWAYSQSPSVPTPGLSGDAANKGYVDSGLGNGPVLVYSWTARTSTQATMTYAGSTTATAYLHSALAIKGTGAAVCVKTIAVASQTVGSYATTGCGFQPDSIIAVSSADPGSTYLQEYGFYDGTNYLLWHKGLVTGATLANSFVHSTTLTNAIALFMDATANTSTTISIDSLDADGWHYHVNTATAPSSNTNLYMIGLKGVGMRVGTFAQQSGTGLQAVTTTGVSPAAVIVGGYRGSRTDNLYDTSLGFIDGGSNASLFQGYGWISSTTHSNHQVSTNYAFSAAALNSTTLTAYASGALTSSGFTLNWGLNDNLARTMGYVAFGGPASAKVVRHVNQ